jgi:uncharacterized protein (UPF0212 family)
VAGDSAFPYKVASRIVRPLAESEMSTLSVDQAMETRRCARLFSGVRIASEWGVKGLVRVFRALLQLPADDHAFRCAVLHIAVRLHNVRVRMMHVGQTCRVFVHQGEKVF